MIEEQKIDTKLMLSIIATGIMSFSGVVVETAMNITFPTLMEEFQVGTSTVQWITTGYLLVLASIIPASSWLNKRFKTKTLFICAICLFILGTLLAMNASVFMVLLAGRLIQGLGTGVALPLMFNIVLEQVPLKRRGVMMGIASLITAMAPAIGPSIGGMIVTHFGWRMIFAALLPLLIISFLMGSFSIRQVHPTVRVSFQLIEYICLVIGFACMIFGVNHASEAGWTSPSVLILFAAALFFLGLFCFFSHRSKTPLIDLHVFRSLPFLLSVVSLVLIQFIVLSLGFLIPNYAQLVNGQGAFLAGCLLLPGCLVGALLSPVSGKLLDRFGAKKPILFGNLWMFVALACFCIFSDHLQTVSFMVFYLFFTIGQGFSVGTTMTYGLSQLDENLHTDGNAVINTLQQLAGAIGTSVVSTIVASVQASIPDLAVSTQQGSSYSFLLLVVFSVLMILCSFFALRYAYGNHLCDTIK